MAWIVLCAYIGWLALAFARQTWRQYRRTGDTGLRISPRPGSAQWWAKLLFIAALLSCTAGPVADIAGATTGPVAVPTLTPHPVVAGIGLALIAASIVATPIAQIAMGSSWRVGVDPDERTRLVTRGPFRMVRNPIFTLVTALPLGAVLAVPNAVSAAGLLLLVAAVQIQVRAVEEPYLLRTHGQAYRDYAAKVGRFLPCIGRLTPPTAPR
ncbi:methyltransferase family protein [Nocardiopsis sediminis]|uniref:Methyltransferase family protein n=1 Tax=Nocardiopsis sediminis TaxID=1778267 RepID=A0ABV8FS62_9ACTN